MYEDRLLVLLGINSRRCRQKDVAEEVLYAPDLNLFLALKRLILEVVISPHDGGTVLFRLIAHVSASGIQQILHDPPTRISSYFILVSLITL
jgi:hypothetical protein